MAISVAVGRPVSIVDLEAPALSKIAALALALLLSVVTLTIGLHGTQKGPVEPAFVPICATLWGTADVLTAFLLLTQFYVSGLLSFVFVGSAYLFVAALTIPYVIYFPGLFANVPNTPGTEQISIALWIVWHVAFPLMVAFYVLTDPRSRVRLLDQSAIRRAIVVGVAGTIAGALAIVVALAAFRDQLPAFVVHGAFQAVYVRLAAPLVTAVNWGVAGILMVALRRPSVLQVWLMASIFAEGLDGLLNSWAPGRYSPSWYVGKVETFITSSLLLGILLGEVGRLYSRLSLLATIDPLTGLRNRRALAEGLRWAVDFTRRKPAPMAVLMIDVDHFKQYNDCYGHVAGDDCLRAIAKVLQKVVSRSSDIVARYGGEEFVVVLSDATPEGATDVANRIRDCVEKLAIPHARSTAGPVVTVSVGVDANPSGARGDEAFFERADAALYRAKEAGRNRCSVV